MKKLLLIGALAATAMGVSANNFTVVERNRPVVETALEVAPEAVTVETVAPRDAAVLKTGDAFYLKYKSFTNYVDNEGNLQANGGTTVELLNDSIVLEGILGDYSLGGKYDKDKGTITIKFPVVVGTYNGGDVTARMIKGSSLYNGTYVITINEEGNLVFSDEYGFYAGSAAGGMAWVDQIKCYKANGKTTLNFSTQSGLVPASNPVLATFDGETKSLTIEGLNSSFCGSYIPTVFTVDTEKKELSFPAKVVFDRNVVNEVARNYYAMSFSDDGKYIQPDQGCVVSYTTDTNSTTITCSATKGMQFVGYNSSGSNWSGFRPMDWTITLDFELGKDVGVEEISVEDAAPVYYNLQGMKVNADNLNAGIYIVRTGNKATKVVVK